MGVQTRVDAKTALVGHTIPVGRAAEACVICGLAWAGAGSALRVSVAAARAPCTAQRGEGVRQRGAMREDSTSALCAPPVPAAHSTPPSSRPAVPAARSQPPGARASGTGSAREGSRDVQPGKLSGNAPCGPTCLTESSTRMPWRCVEVQACRQRVIISGQAPCSQHLPKTHTAVNATYCLLPRSTVRHSGVLNSGGVCCPPGSGCAMEQ